MNTYLLILTVAMTLILLCGDYAIKKATQVTNPELLLWFTAVLWVLSIYGWYYIVRTERESIVGAMFSMLSLVGTVLIGIIGFNEQLTTKEWVGFSLGILAIVLLSGKV